MIQEQGVLTPMTLPGSIPAEQGCYVICSELENSCKRITNSYCELYFSYIQRHTHTLRNRVPCSNSVVYIIGSQGYAEAIQLVVIKWPQGLIIIVNAIN